MHQEYTSGEHLLGEFRRKLDALQDSILTYLQNVDLLVVDGWAAASLDGKGLTEEASAVFDALDALRNTYNDALSHGREVLRSRPTGDPLNEQEWELFRDLNLLDKATRTCFTKTADNINLAFSAILYADPTGRTAQDALANLFRIKQSDLDPKQSDLDHIEGLHTVFRRWLDGTASYSGKPRSYFATAVRNEAKRLLRNREVDKRNRLGITPKESKDLSEEDRWHHRHLNATAIVDDESIARIIDDSPSAEDILVAAVEDREKRLDREMKLEDFRQELPAELATLFDLKLETGLPWAEACRRLGLPQSKVNALRNRINRFKEKLAS